MTMTKTRTLRDDPGRAFEIAIGVADEAHARFLDGEITRDEYNTALKLETTAWTAFVTVEAQKKTPTAAETATGVRITATPLRKVQP